MSFVRLDNLNDFIEPSTTCIKPQDKKPAAGVVAKVKDISLSDCLACSGCITSAETVLVKHQNHKELLRVIESNKTSEETAERIASFLISLGCHKVYDINFARHLALTESYEEFKQRRHLMGGDDKEGKKKGPIISSVCPGWICYAEKTNGDLIIPHLSRVRSPQQIMGAILKEHYVKSSSDSRSKSDVYHVTLMPCFDKKLEASRDQFKQVGEDGNEIKDVDCVLTPLEFEEMLIEKNIKFFDLASRQLDLLIKTDLGFDTALTSHFGSGSGGYAENIMLAEASELLDENETVLSSSLEYSILKNSDFIELTLRKLNEQTNADDYTRKFAIVNGFRNIQTVVQRMKRNALKYDYIEIMACPSGCLNGGAQCKSNAGEDRAETIQATKKLYENIPRVELGFKSKVLKEKISSSLRLDNKSELDEMLYTTFNAVPKMQNLTVNW